MKVFTEKQKRLSSTSKSAQTVQAVLAAGSFLLILAAASQAAYRSYHPDADLENGIYHCYLCHTQNGTDRYEYLEATAVPHHSPYNADYNPSIPDDPRHQYNQYYPGGPDSGGYLCGTCHIADMSQPYFIILQGVGCGDCHYYGTCPSVAWQVGEGLPPQNDPPVLDPIGDKTAQEGVLLTFVVTAADPNAGDILTFSASNLPPGATFDTATATFAWTPPFDSDPQYADILFNVQDNGTPVGDDFELITITVGNVNRAPVFSPVGTQEVLENETLTFSVEATDPDGDSITYSTGALPAGATFDAATATFAWTPDNSQSDNYNVTFYATDNGTPNIAVGETTVVISVGDVPTPTELAAQLVIEVTLLPGLPEEAVNSYLANVKKIEPFIESGKTTAAINQLEAFIHKVQLDLSHGIVSQEDADYLIGLATDLIAMLES